MMPKEKRKIDHGVIQIPMNSCHLTLTILVAKALLNVAWTHTTVATCRISNGQTLKYN
jgi:hypothetical protein